MISQNLINLVYHYSSVEEITETPLDSLKIVRRDRKTGPVHSVYEPCLCLVVQGEKLVTVGQSSFRCEPGNYFASASNQPVVGEVVKASNASPYLCLVLNFDRQQIYEVVEQTGPPQGNSVESGVFIDAVSESLLDAFYRLMRIIEEPKDLRILGPMITREIIYYMMKSQFANVIYELGIKGSRMQKLTGIIEKIRRDYARPLSVENLAKMAHMSQSAFYQNFKKITHLSPIQFQKQVRLQEARRLLSTESDDITSVAYTVGYESPSQFSREYARLFGLPPSRHLKKLQNLA